MSEKKNSSDNIKQIIELFDKFSASLMTLIKRLVKQKIVTLEAVLVMLPKKIKDEVVNDLTAEKEAKKEKRKSNKRVR